MTIQQTARLSVSTWSLHRTLGSASIYGPSENVPQVMKGEGAISLLELPYRIAERGFKSLEICYFHLPSREPAYLAKVRSALDEAEVELLRFYLYSTG